MARNTPFQHLDKGQLYYAWMYAPEVNATEEKWQQVFGQKRNALPTLYDGVDMPDGLVRGAGVCVCVCVCVCLYVCCCVCALAETSSRTPPKHNLFYPAAPAGALPAPMLPGEAQLMPLLASAHR